MVKPHGTFRILISLPYLSTFWLPHRRAKIPKNLTIAAAQTEPKISTYFSLLS